MIEVIFLARPLSQSYSSRSNKFLGVSNRKAKLVVLQVDKLKDQVLKNCISAKCLFTDVLLYTYMHLLYKGFQKTC